MRIYDANEGWIGGGSEIRYSYVYYDKNKQITADNPRGNGYFLAEWHRDEIMLMRWSLLEGRCITKHSGDYTKTLDDAHPYLNKDWQPSTWDYVGVLIYEKDILGSKKMVPHDALSYTSALWQFNTETGAFSTIKPRHLLAETDPNVYEYSLDLGIANACGGIFWHDAEAIYDGNGNGGLKFTMVYSQQP
jgi:hypothetical protein